MTRNNIIALVIILMIFGFAVWALFPLRAEEGEEPTTKLGRTGLNLGLDLVGGVHLVYQAEATENQTELAQNMKHMKTTIEKRIDQYGVTEPTIQILGEDRIMVQLPGFTDIDAAKSLVEQTGFLEFREVELNEAGQPVYLGNYLESSQNQFIDRGETGDRIFVNEKGTPIAFLVKDEAGIKFIDVAGNPIDEETLKQYSQSLAWIPSRGDDGTHLTGDLLADAF